MTFALQRGGFVPRESLAAKGLSGFRYRRNFGSWNQESWPLESGIQLKESGIPLTIWIRNPNSTDRYWNPLPRIWNPLRGIHNPRLSRIPFRGSVSSGTRHLFLPLLKGSQKLIRLNNPATAETDILCSYEVEWYGRFTFMLLVKVYVQSFSGTISV